MNSSNEYEYYKKPKGNNSILALLLIIIGVLFLLRNMGILSYSVTHFVFSWQMLLIALGVWSVSKKQNTSGAILIGLGAIFLIPKLDLFFPDLNLRLITRNTWPIFLIGFGIYLYFSNSSYKKDKRKEFEKKYGTAFNKENSSGSSSTDGAENQKAEEESQTSHTQSSSNQSEDSTDFLSEDFIFSSTFRHVLSQNIVGGDIRVVFGQVIFDLRGAQLKNNKVIIDADIVFGNAVFYVPNHWKVIINSQSVLGSFSDKRFYSFHKTESTEKAPTLIITGSCVFGSGEIKS